MTDSENVVFGAVFPLPKKLISRILDEKRLVYAKFAPHRGHSTKLGRNSIVVFYESKGGRSVVGEAVVRKVEFRRPDQVLDKVGESFFLNSDELMTYVDKYPGRREKEMMVLHLERPKRYDRPIAWSHAMTMAGQYLTKEQYESVFGPKTSESRGPRVVSLA
jgi:hypothetical protein